MLIRIAGIVDESIVDGPGFRFAVFVQGCAIHCPGCHNPETHDFDGGQAMDTGAILERMAASTLLDGLTLSGGDPFAQSAASTELARGAKALGLTVWAYSGERFEDLLARSDARALIENCDVVVDGPFILAQRTLELRFRGSRNQRLVDVKRSLAAGSVVEYPLN